MASFFAWLGDLAREPVGLVFLFGAAALFWLGLALRLGRRWIAYLQRIPESIRKIKTSLAWLRRKPRVDVLHVSEVSVSEEGERLTYELDVRVVAQNRDVGIAWVFLGNLTATLTQYRGFPVRYSLSQAPSVGRVDFDNDGETQTFDIHLVHSFRVREFPTLVPIQLDRVHEVRFSNIRAGIGATANVPNGQVNTKLIKPTPNKIVRRTNEEYSAPG